MGYLTAHSKKKFNCVEHAISVMPATALLQNSSFDVYTKKATDVLLRSVRSEVHRLEKQGTEV
jgi:hypothetical protein